MMNLEIHQKGQSDYLDKVKEQFSKKTQTIKNSELLTSASKKLKIKALKRAFLKEKRASDFNNF